MIREVVERRMGVIVAWFFIIVLAPLCALVFLLLIRYSKPPNRQDSRKDPAFPVVGTSEEEPKRPAE